MPADRHKLLCYGRFISTPAPDVLAIRYGAVVISSADGRGTIEKTHWVDSSENVKLAVDTVSKDTHNDIEMELVESPQTGFFFPGFIDTHIHAPQYPNAGVFGKSTLLDWLTTYTFPLEASLGGQGPLAAQLKQETNGLDFEDNNNDHPLKKRKVDHLERARIVYDKVITRTLSHGTTTASYFATIDVPATNLLADLTHSRGQRAYIGRVCMDHPETCPEFYRDETPEQTIQNAISSIEHIQRLDPKGELVAPIVTPRFAPSCQAESLKALGALAQERQLRVQTHISENKGELELVKYLFPERESYTDVYDHAGLLTDKTILAHGIHLNEKEMDTIKARGSKISHCPASNSSLGSGFCAVRTLLEKGIDVSLGTDVSGGYSVSILDSVRQACLVSRQLGYVNGGDKKWNVGVTEGLWLATVGGAKCVGLEGKLGGFEVGMSWDVQEITLNEVGVNGQDEQMESGLVDIFGWESWEDRVDKWVWNGDDRNVRRVWVGGREVYARKA